MPAPKPSSCPTRRHFFCRTATASRASIAILRRQDPRQPLHALNLTALRFDPARKLLVPFGELGRLRGHGVLQRFNAQYRSQAGHKGGLIDWLRQVVIGSGIEAFDYVSR